MTPVICFSVEAAMIPIEQISQGTLVFLKCGCAAIRLRTHPTGTAAAVAIQQSCDEHTTAGTRLRFVLKGELVSPYVRTLLDFGSTPRPESPSA
jgi:hypothetical protein